MDGFSSYHSNGNAKEPDFSRLTQIGSSIQKISQNVSSMQRMVQHVGTSQDSREFRQQLEQIQQYTQQLAKDTSAGLREVGQAGIGGLSPAELRQWRAQRDRLADEFTAALNAFQAVQRQAAARAREQVARGRAQHPTPALAGPGGGTASSASEQLIELQDGDSTERRRQRQQQLQDEVDLEQLEEQERSIRRLEADISDVNQIFKELGALVHEQGDIVDSIEASVERTQVFVQEGAQQLHQASNYQSKLRKKKFILAMIAAAVLAIIIGIIAWQTSS